jgi:2-iminobutanoate/2-iminopropanoate deaminase
MPTHIKPISTLKAPKPAGHYSQGMIYENLVFVSGQLPIDPESGEKKNGPIEEQAEQVLHNVAAVLEAAGSGLHNVLKTTLYIADISLWDQVNTVYARFFTDHRPARAVVPTKALHHGFLIEMEAIAYIPH